MNEDDIYDLHDLFERIGDAEYEAEELTGRIVEFFKKHPDIPPTEENILEHFPNDDEHLIMKVIDKVIEGLSVTDEQKQNNTAAVKSNPLLGQMMKSWEVYAGKDTQNFLNIAQQFFNL